MDKKGIKGILMTAAIVIAVGGIVWYLAGTPGLEKLTNDEDDE